MLKQFGGSIKKHHQDLYNRSTQWNGKVFENLSKTTMDVNLKTLPGLLKENIKGKKDRSPKENIEILKFNNKRFEPSLIPKFIWYGHSVLLLQLNGKNILIDPMLGEDASPIGPIRTKRFSKNSLEVIDDLPKIDLILLTHDHYDHLDLSSILKLKSKVDSYFVALGVGRHLESWGIPKNQITEFDWWQEQLFENIKLTFTPSRHFSGRGLFDRAKSLWGGWVLESNSYKIYWSGDGGYDTHFKEIGDRFGSFDWGFMECGQYNKRWEQIHMLPEQSVQAGLDANVRNAIPVHWGGFTLALHNWKEPINRFTKEAKQQKMNYLTPKIGEVVHMNETININWWEDL